MDKRARRRVNPVAHIALAAVGLLLVFQCLVICGVLELRARLVAKYAPWAYEPFLRLVGEHPDSAPRWAAVEETEEPGTESPVAGVMGFEPSVIPVLMDSNANTQAVRAPPAATNAPAAAPEADPAAAPTNAPAEKPQEAVPVG